MTPTTPENIARINKMFNDTSNLLEQLAARWTDEKEYEDIAEYQKVLVAKMPTGFVFTKMNKRPFGFRFTIGTDAEYQMYVKGRKIGWERIK